MKFKVVESIELENEKRLNENIKKLPKIGHLDKKTGVTLLPKSEYDPADDIWDKIYAEKFGE